MNTVYLLEDNVSICDLIEYALQSANISCRSFNTVQSFNSAVMTGYPDVLLLDIMLPDGNGVEVLKTVKQKSPETRCIMLSALSSEMNKVNALDAGADDYITKPFGVLELIARIKANLRRVNKSAVLTFGNLSLNEDSMTATLNGELLPLSNKEFSLLKYFMENAGLVLTREQILSAVWGYENGETRTLDNYIVKLRKLGIDNVVTVFGKGYKFEKGA